MPSIASDSKAEGEFDVLGPRKHAVKLGDVFGWRLTGEDRINAGQVLDVEVDLAGATLLLMAFFDVAADVVASDPGQMQVGRIIGRPYITNRTGWFDGYFVRVSNLSCVSLGRVGLETLSGKLLDLRGVTVARDDLDVVIPYRLSPPGAIAQYLARGGR